MKISTTDDLKQTFQRIKHYTPRFGVDDIIDYVLNEDAPIICGVIGLKRTGKTTMLWHGMQQLYEENQQKSLYIEMEPDDDIIDLTNCIEKYAKDGYSIFFIDEITNIQNLANNGASLANTYPARGLKIIISGTDSLLLNITERSVFYNKILPVPTTWMPWREYAGIVSTISNDDPNFEDYLENGGILANNIRSKTSTSEYIKTAIVDNLVNSLDNDDNGRNYGALFEFRNRGKLKDFVLRVLNDNTHRFFIKLLTGKHSINEFEATSAFVRSKSPNFDKNRIKLISERIKAILGYQDWQPGQPVPNQAEIKEVEGWLKIMGVFISDPIRPVIQGAQTEFLLSQPALRWHQVLNVFDTIFTDAQFMEILGNNFKDAKRIFTSSLKGELLEDIVLIDTIKTLNDSDVFSWHFSPLLHGRQDEFDMVIVKDDIYDIFEIKKNSRPSWEQSKHLRHEPYLEYFKNVLQEPRYRIVLYRGEEFVDFDDVMHLNVEDFLFDLPCYHQEIDEQFQILQKERSIYDKNMAEWLEKNINKADFFDYVEQYFARSLPEQEMIFADWIRKKGIEIPYPFEINQKNVNGSRKDIFNSGLDLTEMQRAIDVYDKKIAEKDDIKFSAWLKENFENNEQKNKNNFRQR